MNSGFCLSQEEIKQIEDKRRGDNYMREQFKNETEIRNYCREIGDSGLRDAFFTLTQSWPLLYASSDGISRRIVDVNIIVPNKVVEVAFMDGDKQKAVCQEPDVFSLEQAISICLTKHLLGGSGKYNKAIKDGIKIYQDKIKCEKHMAEERVRIAKRREKQKAYMQRRAERRREEQIEIQKEAYVRALREVNLNKGE